ncbi:MAG: DUF983 domain-containing protein [Pseudomonadota bacterium]
MRPLWWDVAVLGRCPHCGGGRIFKAVLALKKHCPNCKQSLAAYEQADGPAFFVIILVGAIMLPITLKIFAMGIPAFWSMVFIGLLTALFVVISLRLIKGILIAAQYTTGAREGRLDHQDP